MADQDTSTEPDFKDESSAQDFIDKITSGRNYTEYHDFEGTFDGETEQLTLEFSPILDRHKRADFTKRLPEGWFEAGQKDSIEDVNIGSLVPDGDNMGALEDLVLASASHPHLSPSALEVFVKQGLSDGALTEAGLHVLQMSTDERVNKVQSFHKRE